MITFAIHQINDLIDFMTIINFKKNVFKKSIAYKVILALIIFGFICVSIYKYTTPTPEWFACNQDNECTDTTLCNGNAINKDYVSRSTIFNKLLGSAETKCWKRKYSARGSFCKNLVCVADEDSSPEDWNNCMKDSDCVEVENSCGYKEAVNKRFKDVAKKFYLVPEKRKCPRVPKGEFYITCENSQCKGVYK